jgi:integrase
LTARLKAAGIEHGTLHTFRHTFATFLANNPVVPLVHVQKVLGHKSIETTMRYVHANLADVTASLSRVDFSEMTKTAEENGSESSQLPVKRENGGQKSVA